MQLEFQLDSRSAQPVYLQLKSELLRLIRENDMQAGNMLPPVQELAGAAGVSVRTMDHALKELIRGGYCFRRPKKGTFIGSAPRRRSSKEKQIAILYVPGFGLEYFNTDQADRGLYAGMRREAAGRGVDLLLVNNDLEYYLESVTSEVRGVLLLESEPLEEVMALSERFPAIRFVYVNYFMPGFESTNANVYGVFNDDFGGAFQIAGYFFRRGCRNVRIPSFELDNLNYMQRLKGFQFAADQYNVNLERAYLPLPPPTGGMEEMIAAGAALAEAQLRQDPAIDLFLCTSDLLGHGVYRYLEGAGLPGRVRVAGYDGYRVYGVLPEFSTMQIDFLEIGAQALAVAISRRPVPKQIKIFPNFINQETESTKGTK